MSLPKLEIVPRDDCETPWSLNHLQVKLDGLRLDYVTSLDLSLGTNDVNEVSLRMRVGEVHVDAEAMTALFGYMSDEDKERLKANLSPRQKVEQS